MSLKALGLNATKGLFAKQAELTRPVQSILNFKKYPDTSADKILSRSDQELGGYSTVNFDIDPVEKCGHFHGTLSLDLPKDNAEVTRSGYAMFRTTDLKDSWLLGNKYWDWTNYSSLVMRVKGDRRKYLVNIQANTPLVTDLFQHRLFLHHPGQWETVVIPLNDFVMTNWGVIQDGSELNKAEVKSVGVGLLDKQYGPYSLKIEWIKVMTGAEVAKVAKKSRLERLTISNEGEIQEDGTTATKNAGGAMFGEPKKFI